MIKQKTHTTQKKRGFQALSPERRREIAQKGGKAAHEKGTAYKLTVEDRSKGGSQSSGNFKYRVEDAKRAGRIGGKKSRRHAHDAYLLSVPMR